MKGNRSSRLAPELLKKAHEMFRNGYSALDVSESLGFSYTTAKLIRRNMNLTPDQVNWEEQNDWSDGDKYRWLKKYWNWKQPKKRSKKTQWKLKTPYHW